MDIDNVKLNQTKEYFSSPDIGWNEYNNNQYRQKVTRLFNSNKSRSITYLSSFDLNSEELIQVFKIIFQKNEYFSFSQKSKK